MKPSSNVCGTTTKVPSKRDEKKQINIRWNSGIFFQVGLIVSLLAMFFVMELEIGVKPQVAIAKDGAIWETPPTIIYKVEKEPITKPVEKQKKIAKRTQVKVTKAITHVFKKIDDISKELEGKVISEGEPVVTTPTTPVITKGNETPPTKNIMGVEFVPIYPGCEGAIGNQAKIECMSSKIRAFIGRKFDAGKFNYFEPGSIQSIHTVFTIDTYGNVVDIQARAADKNLEKEARRVISKLPNITPGKQGVTAVNVTYAVPISFQVRN